MDNFRRSIFAPKTSIIPIPQSRRNENKIVLNVGGVRFETYKTTLKSIPDTRLSWLSDSTGNTPEFDPVSGEFFFDRHSGMFHMILNYYRTGKLHIPMDVCGPAFEEELAYWGLDENQIEPCCWNTYRAHRDAQQTLAEFEGHDPEGESDDEEESAMRERFGISEDFVEVKKSTWERWKIRIWNIVDAPRTNLLSRIFAIVSVFFIILSIASFCLETHSKFRYDISSNSSGEPRTIVEQVRNTRPHVLFQVLEYMCMVFFTFEVTVRFISCPNKSKFIKDFYNWIELFSVIPFYTLIIANCISPAFITTDIGIFINAMRFIRIFRILKLTRYFSSLKVIGHTIRASAKELLLLFLVLIIGVLIFGVLIYFAEQIQEDTQNDFSDIPISFYWAVETMTTLGYGDIVPRTMSGYIIGCACAVCGLLMLSLPVPIIVSNFTLYYTHAQAKMKLPKKNKNILVGAANALKESSFGTVTPVDSNGSAGGECSKESRRNSNDSALGSCNSTESPPSMKEQVGISVIFTNETPPGNTSPASSGSPGQKRKLSDIKEIPGRRCSSLEAPSPTIHRLNRSGTGSLRLTPAKRRSITVF